MLKNDTLCSVGRTIERTGILPVNGVICAFIALAILFLYLAGKEIEIDSMCPALESMMLAVAHSRRVGGVQLTIDHGNRTSRVYELDYVRLSIKGAKTEL